MSAARSQRLGIPWDHSQWGGAGGRGHAPIVEAVLTQSLPQAATAAALHLVGRFPGKRRLQLSPLGAHLLVLGLDVILAVLALVLQAEHTHTIIGGEMQLEYKRRKGRTYTCAWHPPGWPSVSRARRSSSPPCRCRSPGRPPSAAPSAGDPPSGSPAWTPIDMRNGLQQILPFLNFSFAILKRN